MKNTQIFFFRGFFLGWLTAFGLSLGWCIPELLFLSLLQPGLWKADGLQLFWAPWVNPSLPKCSSNTELFRPKPFLHLLSHKGSVGHSFLSLRSCEFIQFKCQIPNATKTTRRYHCSVRYFQYLERETSCPPARTAQFPTTPTPRDE